MNRNIKMSEIMRFSVLEMNISKVKPTPLETTSFLSGRCMALFFDYLC